MNERSIQAQSLIDAKNAIALYPDSEHRKKVFLYLETAELWLKDLEEKQLTGPTAPSVQD